MITAEALQVWRAKMGMSQEQLADHLGISAGMICHYETGRHAVTARTARQIANLARQLKVSPPE